MARPTREEIKKKMVELVRKNKPYQIEALWMATRKAFKQKISDMHTDRWIPEIEIRQAISELLFERENLFMLPDRRLGSLKHYKAANK